MTVKELVSYAEEKYHIVEEQKWDHFKSYSVLVDPLTNKWVALLMRYWDFDTGTDRNMCDIKCGKQILREISAPYVANAFRMKGSNWVGVLFDERTEPEVVFRLFDEAIRAGRSGGHAIVLREVKKEESDGKVFTDTLLPLEALRGNYDKSRVKENGATSAQIPDRILKMMQMYDYGAGTYENKCRNFVKQGKFMENYEDDAPWGSDFRRYFATYHDLNLKQLRGYFAWRTRVRKGEFHQITPSLAYMYIYELLNGIGTDCAADGLRKMKDFEAGYIETGYGDKAMRDNLHRWIVDYAVINGVDLQQILPYMESDLLERDRLLLVLRDPGGHSDEEIFLALSGLTGGKIEKSSAVKKEPERAKALFAGVWRYMAEHYEDQGWDIFGACFGKIGQYAWHPLANAVYFHDENRADTEYIITPCRKMICKGGEWFTVRYNDLYFDKYKVQAILHEADRLIRRYLGTGSPLREKEGEEWITPYVEAVIEADRAAREEAARPKITIDLSGLDKIRRDARITRESLLTEEERGEPVFPVISAVEQEPVLSAISAVAQDSLLSVTPSVEQAPKEEEKADQPALELPAYEKTDKPAVEKLGTYVHNGANCAIIEIPSLDQVHAQVLVTLMRGGSAQELIRENYLMPAVVADTINEALFDEIGDNVLSCDGDELTLVEDYREELAMILNGEG